MKMGLLEPIETYKGHVQVTEFSYAGTLSSLCFFFHVIWLQPEEVGQSWMVRNNMTSERASVTLAKTHVTSHAW